MILFRYTFVESVNVIKKKNQDYFQKCVEPVNAVQNQGITRYEQDNTNRKPKWKLLLFFFSLFFVIHSNRYPRVELYFWDQRLGVPIFAYICIRLRIGKKIFRSLLFEGINIYSINYAIGNCINTIILNNPCSRN